MFDFGEEQYFCLGRRFSKQKITRYAKNLGEIWPLAQPMFMAVVIEKKTRKDY